MGLVLLPCIPQISFFKKTQGFDMWQIYGQSKIITIKAKPCAGTAIGQRAWASREKWDLGEN